ncbi:unnamed protein product [Leptosia nina]|uniref:Uncharacterized protein n=1 Tax=Leptosia nina TaxID=320188 RepID=A0AAV1JXD8_9NEOP
MLPIAEMEEGARRLLSANANRHRKTRDRVVTAEIRAIRRRRGWTVVGSETRCHSSQPLWHLARTDIAGDIARIAYFREAVSRACDKQ